MFWHISEVIDQIKKDLCVTLEKKNTDLPNDKKETAN